MKDEKELNKKERQDAIRAILIEMVESGNFPDNSFDIRHVEKISSFKKLSKLHPMLLVEGMGGIMTPILKDYFVTDLIKEMKIPAVIVTRSKVGTVNHTIMTVKMCQKYKIPIKGIIINNFDTDGYKIKSLKRDLENLTGMRILGTIPYIENLSDESLYKNFKKNITEEMFFRIKNN